MALDIKNINIGFYISQKVEENDISSARICNFFKCTEPDIKTMLDSKTITTDQLLRWSKLLEYDFFRLYTQHLILYAPSSTVNYKKNSDNTTSKLPQFRKNIYTREIIDFLLELIETKKKTKIQVIEEYGIPKTTLYKWILKHGKN